MSFASPDFVIFFAIVFSAVLILQRFKNSIYKEVFLLIASFFFYCYWDWRFGFLLLFVIVCAYITALHVDKKPALVIGVTIPLIALAFFKYFNFFLSSFAALINRDLGVLSIILPVGISFYTFQALSYVIDVKRGKLAAEKNFVKLALYVSFFPQLVAGPIVKAADFLPQLHQDNRKITLKNVERGVQLMVFGLFKKIVIADQMSVFIDAVFKTPNIYSWVTILLAVVSYSIQIYFDFSGYSDIAIGCAKCLGYDFCPNFNMPYISQNVTEFWRRWHISLSTWLKEYLYIPLGGNRKGKIRQNVNLMATMLLGGLWHGANWTFVFWGGLNGAALCIDKLFKKKKDSHAIVKCLNILGTYLFILFTWIFFRADSFSKAWEVIRAIFTLQTGVVHIYSWSILAIAVVLIATIIAVIKAKRDGAKEVNGFYPTVKLNTVWGMTIFLVACGLVLGLAFTGEAPFVYFQF